MSHGTSRTQYEGDDSSLRRPRRTDDAAAWFRVGNWFKSSYSAADNKCVEVAHSLPRVGIRDSKASGQSGFTVSAAAFGSFVDGLKKDSGIYPTSLVQPMLRRERRNAPKGPPAPRMAGGPFGAFGDRNSGVTGGQEALACSAFGLSAALDLLSVLLAAATGAGLAAS
ncbi:DUF397 domain-containing protein [Streptomyces sp. V4I2]|uniref:DUF397 domain-containing protein n=1 Tax=Streptomyces sp. V4I2 TaxID=3042280 RepID=UPI0027D7AA7E|nr:DUF397 domain-containing protein [Streptomyces sp. V4I2]